MKRKLRRRHRSGGFTLMEVLLVLAILVILGSSVGMFLLGAQKKAYTRAAASQMSTFEQILTMYRMDLGSYPSTDQGLQALRVDPGNATTTRWDGPYAAKDIPLDPWGNPYQYTLESADVFHIFSWGPDGQAGNDDDVSNT